MFPFKANKSIFVRSLIYILVILLALQTQMSSTENNVSNINLLELDQLNFDEVTTSNDFVFVLFYKKNSKRSEEVFEEFERASKLKELYSNVIFSLVDKDDPNSEQIIKDLDFKSFPRVVLYYLGYPLIYESGYLENNFKIYLEMKLESRVLGLSSFEELKEFRKRKESVIFIGDSSSKKDQKYSSFLKASKHFDDVIFAECSSQECMENFDTFSGLVSVYNGFSDDIYNLENFSDRQLISFISEKTTKVYPTLDEEATKTIFNSYSVGLFIFVDGTSEAQQKNILYFYRAARNLKKAIHMVVAEFHSHFGRQVADVLKLQAEDLPKVYIIDSRKEDIQIYKMDKEINEQNIFDFAKSWGQNNLNAEEFSEEIPRKQTFPILTLVGKNYKELVVDSEDNFLVYYYKPECEPCKKFDKIFRKVANGVIKEYGPALITFGKINGEINDMPGISILAYPAVNLYLKGKKDKPERYELEDFDVAKLIGFITYNYKGILDMEKILIRIKQAEDEVNLNLNENTNSDPSIDKGNVEVNYVKNEM